jgi:NAD(P)-dependent dehydrogenase (short-subunit alcohol dehydrogenase family)
MARSQGKNPAEIEKEFFNSARPSSLLRRFGTPEEVAAVVGFVAGTNSTLMNGSAVRAEGGVVRSVF